MKTDIDSIEILVTPIVKAMGYIVWHIEFQRAKHKNLLRIYVDVPDGDMRKGVNLDDCSSISNQIGALLDVEGHVLGSYVLEVSSPGTNRSLFKFEHYKRYVGNTVRVILRQPINERSDYVGKIKKVVYDILKLAVGDEEVEINITNISKAKLISCS